MSFIGILEVLVRAIFAFGSVILIGLTSNAVRAALGDVVYVINAAFLLFGGMAIGTYLGRLVSRFGKR